MPGIPFDSSQLTKMPPSEAAQGLRLRAPGIELEASVDIQQLPGIGLPAVDHPGRSRRSQMLETTGLVLEHHDRILDPAESTPGTLEDPEPIVPAHRLGIVGMVVAVVDQDVPRPDQVDLFRRKRRQRTEDPRKRGDSRARSETASPKGAQRGGAERSRKS